MIAGSRSHPSCNQQSERDPNEESAHKGWTVDRHEVEAATLSLQSQAADPVMMPTRSCGDRGEAILGIGFETAQGMEPVSAEVSDGHPSPRPATLLLAPKECGRQKEARTGGGARPRRRAHSVTVAHGAARIDLWG